MLGKQVRFIVLIAGGDETFESQQFEVEGEVLEEITDTRVVAVTQDYFILEVGPIVLQLIFYIRQLRIELVSFICNGSVKICVPRSHLPRISILAQARKA